VKVMWLPVKSWDRSSGVPPIRHIESAHVATCAVYAAVIGRSYAVISVVG